MWDKITVGKFQELYDIITGHNFDHEFERQIKLLSCLDGRPEEYYEDMTVQHLQEECKRVAFLSVGQIPVMETPRTVTVSGRRYKVFYEFKDFSAGQFIDVMNIAQTPEEHILNLNKMLACVCIPMDGKRPLKYCEVPFDEVAEEMLQLPISAAYSISVFFYRVWNAYLKAIPGCLEKKQRRGIPLTEMESVMLAASLSVAGDGC